jgi:hypothetical protein
MQPRTSERVIKVVRPSYREVDHVYAQEQCVIECIQEPAGERLVGGGEHSEDEQLAIRSDPQTLFGEPGDHAGHEGPVADLVVDGGVGGPVGALTHVAEVRVLIGQPGVEDRHLDGLPRAAAGLRFGGDGGGDEINKSEVVHARQSATVDGRGGRTVGKRMSSSPSTPRLMLSHLECTPLVSK